jgi:hypothetical protein
MGGPNDVATNDGQASGPQTPGGEAKVFDATPCTGKRYRYRWLQQQQAAISSHAAQKKEVISSAEFHVKLGQRT